MGTGSSVVVYWKTSAVSTTNGYLYAWSFSLLEWYYCSVSRNISAGYDMSISVLKIRAMDTSFVILFKYIYLTIYCFFQKSYKYEYKPFNWSIWTPTCRWRSTVLRRLNVVWAIRNGYGLLCFRLLKNASCEYNQWVYVRMIMFPAWVVLRSTN